MKYISDEVQGQVSALEGRERHFTWRLKHLVPFFLSLFAGALFLLILTGVVAPKAHPSEVDVPDKLLELFGPETKYTDTALSVYRRMFLHGVEVRDAEDVETSLRNIGQLYSPLGFYVMAQVVLAKNEKKSATLFHFDADFVDQLARPSVGFPVTAEALYALEKAAFGAPKSPAAVAYYKKQAEKANASALYAVLIFLICVVGFMGVGFVFMLRLAIRRRLERIHGLLQRLN